MGGDLQVQAAVDVADIGLLTGSGFPRLTFDVLYAVTGATRPRLLVDELGCNLS
jgi:hypothetical protein